MKKIKNILKDLLIDILEYGMTVTYLEFPNTSLRPEAYQKALIKNCHTGFRKAQLSIIKELLENQNSVKHLNEELKISRINRDKERVNNLKDELNKIKFEIKIYKKVADSIAWQLFYAQPYVARKLNAGEENESYLSESNIQYTTKVVDELHTNHPESFALITDITSFISIGDILLKNAAQLLLIELKEGETNIAIKNLITNAEKSEITTDKFFEEVNKTHNKKFLKQAQRMIKQGIKMKKFSQVINNGFNFDNFTNLPSFIPEEPLEVEDFTPILVDLVNELWVSDKDWKYTVIENCLFIGIYRNKFAQIGNQLIQELIFEESGEKFPVFDYISLCLNEPLAEPFYLKPFSKNQLIAMTFGDIKILSPLISMS